MAENWIEKISTANSTISAAVSTVDSKVVVFDTTLSTGLSTETSTVSSTISNAISVQTSAIDSTLVVQTSTLADAVSTVISTTVTVDISTITSSISTIDSNITDIDGYISTIDSNVTVISTAVPGLAAIEDAVYYSSTSAETGTDWPVGTAQHPSNDLDDVASILGTRQLNKVIYTTDATLTAAIAAITGITHVGVNKEVVITLGGQDVSNNHFYNCTVVGAQGGAGYMYLHNCGVGTITDFAAYDDNSTYIPGGILTPRIGSISFLYSPNAVSFWGGGYSSYYTTIDFTSITGAAVIITGACGVWFVSNSTNTNNVVLLGGSSGCCMVAANSNDDGSFAVWGDAVLVDNGGTASSTDSTKIGPYVCDGGIASDSNVKAELDLILADTGAIEPIISALPTLNVTDGTVSTNGAAEVVVYEYAAPPATFKPICVKVDFSLHGVTETVVLRTYYKIKTGGTYRLQDEATYAGLVSPVLVNIDLEPNRWGVKVIIAKTAGTNRNYDFEVFYEE